MIHPDANIAAGHLLVYAFHEPFLIRLCVWTIESQYLQALQKENFAFLGIMNPLQPLFLCSWCFVIYRASQILVIVSFSAVTGAWTEEVKASGIVLELSTIKSVSGCKLDGEFAMLRHRHTAVC